METTKCNFRHLDSQRKFRSRSEQLAIIDTCSDNWVMEAPKNTTQTNLPRLKLLWQKLNVWEKEWKEAIKPTPRYRSRSVEEMLESYGNVTFARRHLKWGWNFFEKTEQEVCLFSVLLKLYQAFLMIDINNVYRYGWSIINNIYSLLETDLFRLVHKVERMTCSRTGHSWQRQHVCSWHFHLRNLYHMYGNCKIAHNCTLHCELTVKTSTFRLSALFITVSVVLAYGGSIDHLTSDVF